ncbi:hypothetical protein GCM10009642_51790 [Nocardiopsis metallicus]
MYWDWVPWRDPRIWGSATETIVPLSIVTPRTIISPLRERMIGVRAVPWDCAVLKAGLWKSDSGEWVQVEEACWVGKSAG